MKRGSLVTSASGTVDKPDKKRRVAVDDRDPDRIKELLSEGKLAAKQVQLKADYWKYFSKICNITDNGAPAEDIPFICCNKCKKVYRHSQTSGSSQFDNHAKSCYSKQEEDPTQPPIDAFLYATPTAEDKRKVSESAAT